MVNVERLDVDRWESVSDGTGFPAVFGVLDVKMMNGWIQKGAICTLPLL